MLSRRHLFVFALLCAAAVALLFNSPSSASGGLVLVVNAKNAKSLSVEEVKRIFLGETSYWLHNVPVKLILRPSDSPAGENFYRAIGVPPSRLKRIWQEKQLSGQGNAPDTIKAIGDVLSKVAASPGGVSFAMSAEIPAKTPGIRVVSLK
jgi:ABC-type phosphate transport system substrate-binding protein